MIRPDLQGFRQAQERSRLELGIEVEFLIPPTLTPEDYPPGTSFDPETGLPFDPVVEPTSGEVDTAVTKKVLVSSPRGWSGDASQLSPIGWVESAEHLLILSPEDKAEVEAATRVRLYDELQKVLEWRPDGLDQVYRWFCFVQGA